MEKRKVKTLVLFAVLAIALILLRYVADVSDLMMLVWVFVACVVLNAYWAYRDRKEKGAVKLRLLTVGGLAVFCAVVFFSV
jgi:4-hydroxybenzoate polyprenyltransferase